MPAFVLKILFPVSMVGLLAAGEMEFGSLSQLGVAGVSLGILFWVITRTFPEIVEKIMARHAASNDAMCAKLDEIKKSIDAGKDEQIILLREATKK